MKGDHNHEPPTRTPLSTETHEKAHTYA